MALAAAAGAVLFSIAVTANRAPGTNTEPGRLQETGSSDHAVAFRGGAPSQEALVNEFLAVLRSGNEARLHEIRVNREEYLEIIVPGTVAPGEPLRRVSEKPAEYFWQLLDTKSRDFAHDLVRGHEGHAYTLREMHFRKDEREYALYKARGPVELVLDTVAGDEMRIKTGWIAEVGGRYKFLGYQHD